MVKHTKLIHEIKKRVYKIKNNFTFSYNYILLYIINLLTFTIIIFKIKIKYNFRPYILIEFYF